MSICAVQGGARSPPLTFERVTAQAREPLAGRAYVNLEGQKKKKKGWRGKRQRKENKTAEEEMAEEV